MNTKTISTVSAEIAQAYLSGKTNITILGITLTNTDDMLKANMYLENILNTGDYGRGTHKTPRGHVAALLRRLNAY